MSITIERYTKEAASEWNDFVATSKNGTFLFDRRYMDYHCDRFTDHSLIFRNEKGLIIALLPANEKDGTLHSHQGLTYGGMVMSVKTKTTDIMSACRILLSYLQEHGFSKMTYKPVPWIYHTVPAEEDLYAMFQVCNAKLSERSIASTIFTSNPLKWQELRRRGLAKAQKELINVRESDNLTAYWHILEQNLLHTHNATPVHSIEEMLRLRDSFPDNIKLYIAEDRHGNMVAGILTYITKNTVHTQYISANEYGKKHGAVDAIVRYLQDTFTTKQFLDLGTSTLDSGTTLHESLIFQKEGFGGRGVCYDSYEITIKS